MVNALKMVPYSNLLPTGTEFCLQRGVQNLNKHSTGSIVMCNYLDSYYEYDVTLGRPINDAHIALYSPRYLHIPTVNVDSNSTGNLFLTKVCCILTRVGKKGKRRISYTEKQLPILASPLLKTVSGYLTEVTPVHCWNVSSKKAFDKQKNIELFFEETNPFTKTRVFSGRDTKHEWLVNDASDIEFLIYALCLVGQLIEANGKAKRIVAAINGVPSFRATIPTNKSTIPAFDNVNGLDLLYKRLITVGELDYPNMLDIATQLFNQKQSRELLLKSIVMYQAQTFRSQQKVLLNNLCGILDICTRLLTNGGDNTGDQYKEFVKKIANLSDYIKVAILSLDNRYMRSLKDSVGKQKLVELRCTLINRFI